RRPGRAPLIRRHRHQTATPLPAWVSIQSPPGENPSGSSAFDDIGNTRTVVPSSADQTCQAYQFVPSVCVPGRTPATKLFDVSKRGRPSTSSCLPICCTMPLSCGRQTTKACWSQLDPRGWTQLAILNQSGDSAMRDTDDPGIT